MLVLVDFPDKLLRYAECDVLLPGALLSDGAGIMTAMPRVNRDDEDSGAFPACRALAVTP